MNKIYMRALLLIFLLLPSMEMWAQEQKNFMRDNGRIYVVVAVMVTILLGLILYITRLDRKIRRIEKEFEKNPNK